MVRLQRNELVVELRWNLLHTVLSLTGRTMTQLAVQWFSSAELILDLSAMAIGLVLDIKIFPFFVNAIGRALLPLGNTSSRLASALVLVHDEACLRKVRLLSREVGHQESDTVWSR